MAISRWNKSSNHNWKSSALLVAHLISSFKRILNKWSQINWETKTEKCQIPGNGQSTYNKSWPIFRHHTGASCHHILLQLMIGYHKSSWAVVMFHFFSQVVRLSTGFCAGHWYGTVRMEPRWLRHCWNWVTYSKCVSGMGPLLAPSSPTQTSCTDL